MTKLIRSSILAGIAIGFAGFGFLASGVQSEAYGPVVGAILFCFGLLTVVGYKLSLYTGTAGFIRKGEVGMLCVVLLGNIFGFMMTTSVKFAREKNYLPLLFAVPLFIVCGFTHCVADAFYYLCVPVAFLKAHAWQVLGVYVCIVLGNLIGCNLYRIVLHREQYD